MKEMRTTITIIAMGTIMIITHNQTKMPIQELT
jgi:hypothetical protein